jgi:hypothetical protein
MQLTTRALLTLAIAALLSACGGASDRASEAMTVNVSGVPAGQCRLEASGAASVTRVVAGTVMAKVVCNELPEEKAS